MGQILSISSLLRKISSPPPTLHSEQKATIYGGLITTIQTLAKQSLSMHPTYIEYDQVAVTVVLDADYERSSMVCALFHDVDDGPDFGRLIAKAILSGFLKEYPEFSTVGRKPSIQNQKMTTFSNKLVDIISNAAQSILSQVKAKHKGLVSALLLFDEGQNPVTSGKLDDHVGAVANLQALISFSDGIMSARQDVAQSITLELFEKIVFIHRLRNGRASLVCICKKSIKKSVHLQHIEETVSLLEKLFVLQSNLISDH